ncbi:MAG TPA: hypothetical protein VEF34_10115 [Syntrophobacteraceae bacterium]|nr:hypothetical protein [Syntrophobacteraceae bacterium]
MNNVESSVEKQCARPPEVNVEVTDKPVDSFNAREAKQAAKATESREAVRKQREEKLDLWMKNVKEFIRKIDVKSL